MWIFNFSIDVLCKKCLDNIAMIKLQKKHHYCKYVFVLIYLTFPNNVTKY